MSKTMSPTRNSDEILAVVTECLAEVMETDFELDDPITLETSFNADLELESIEFVALAEKLQARFGDGVDFTGWIANKELEEIIALTVGDLVEFIASCPTSSSTD